MANAAAPFGLKPVRYLNGGPYNGASLKCYVSSSYATAIFVGDIVDLDTTLTNKDTTAKHQTVILAGTGTYADDVVSFGVVISCEPNPNDLSKCYIPASTGGYVYVCVDPDVVYQVQDDGAGTPSKVFVGQNTNFTYAAGNTSTGIGKTVLDTSTPAANASFMGFILGLSDIPNNELDDYAIWDVILNKMRLNRGYSASGDYGIIGVTAS